MVKLFFMFSETSGYKIKPRMVVNNDGRMSPFRKPPIPLITSNTDTIFLNMFIGLKFLNAFSPKKR